MFGRIAGFPQLNERVCFVQPKVLARCQLAEVVNFGIQCGEHSPRVANRSGLFQFRETRLDHLLSNDLVDQQENKKDRCQRKNQFAAQRSLVRWHFRTW